MLGNQKIAGHFLFYELTNLWGLGVYNVNYIIISLPYYYLY